MARHIFQRDFTLARAGFLAILIGVAAMAGEVPETSGDLADLQPAKARIIPAALFDAWFDCDAAKTGINL